MQSSGNNSAMSMKLPKSTVFSRRSSTSSMMGSVPQFEKKNTTLELNTKKDLNVSAGRVFYEKASSRRERTRLVLREHGSANCIPLHRPLSGPTGPGTASLVRDDLNEVEDRHHDLLKSLIGPINSNKRRTGEVRTQEALNKKIPTDTQGQSHVFSFSDAVLLASFPNKKKVSTTSSKTKTTKVRNDKIKHKSKQDKVQPAITRTALQRSELHRIVEDPTSAILHTESRTVPTSTSNKKRTTTLNIPNSVPYQIPRTTESTKPTLCSIPSSKNPPPGNKQAMGFHQAYRVVRPPTPPLRRESTFDSIHPLSDAPIRSKEPLIYIPFNQATIPVSNHRCTLATSSASTATTNCKVVRMDNQVNQPGQPPSPPPLRSYSTFVSNYQRSSSPLLRPPTPPLRRHVKVNTKCYPAFQVPRPPTPPLRRNS